MDIVKDDMQRAGVTVEDVSVGLLQSSLKPSALKEENCGELLSDWSVYGGGEVGWTGCQNMMFSRRIHPLTPAPFKDL